MSVNCAVFFYQLFAYCNSAITLNSALFSFSFSCNNNCRHSRCAVLLAIDPFPIIVSYNVVIWQNIDFSSCIGLNRGRCFHFEYYQTTKFVNCKRFYCQDVRKCTLCSFLRLQNRKTKTMNSQTEKERTESILVILLGRF